MIELKYEHIFNDHMEIAKQRFIQQNQREPTAEEQLNEYRRLMEYFYE